MKRNCVWIACVSYVTVLAACSGPDRRDDTKAMNTAPTPEPAAAVMVSDAANGKPVTASCPPNALYAAGGVKSLVDGRMGSDDYLDPEWMGWWYEDKPFEATIDLGKMVAIKELGVHTLTSSEVWIFYPRKVEFEVSKDGKTYKKIATITPTAADLTKEYSDTTILKASDLKEDARYVRVRVERYGELPNWHMGHGGADGYEGEAWLFIDEILVNPR